MQESLKMRINNINHRSSFTLIELLIVVAILAVLSVIIILVLNPAELLKQARDANRLTELAAIDKALQIFGVEVSGGFMGTSSVLYVSVPDSSATTTAGTNCSSLGMPSLPSGWAYHCSASSTYRNVNGLGWIPVNLTQIPSKSPLGTLPVDPVNATSSGNYYTYVAGGSWELNTRLESTKYGYNEEGTGKATLDGGNNDYLYEVGTNLSLILDNENALKDGDMELDSLGYWGDYSYNPPSPTIEKVTDTRHSGSRSLHLVTADAGYEGTTQGFTPILPTSGRVYIQLSYKVAPTKVFGWECNCSNLGCCWYMLFNGGTSTEWKRLSTIRDISASTGLNTAYFSQEYGVPSEFWLDDIIIRPVY